MTDPQPQWVSHGTSSPGRGGDYDAEAVPVRNAATVLILAERPDLHVLMLKRNARSVFVGDMWVFPGGAVDPDDATDEADARVSGLTNADASGQLDVDGGGIAFWVAALRETFEEAGLLLGSRRGDDQLFDLSPPDVAARFEDHRDRLNNREGSFLEIMRDEDVVLDGSGVHYVGRWVTPVGPPRRYDTHFFVTAMPDGQVALHDNDEAVHHEWVRPADAIAANQRDEMIMMTPTVAMLMRLAKFDTAAAAIVSAANATSANDEAVRIRYNTEGPERVVFPGESAYVESDREVEFGRVRWPLG